MGVQVEWDLRMDQLNSNLCQELFFPRLLEIVGLRAVFVDFRALQKYTLHSECD